ncbi:hypothetical protein ACOME3_006513 [Neoechinorhynchus agilis]
MSDQCRIVEDNSFKAYPCLNKKATCEALCKRLNDIINTSESNDSTLLSRVKSIFLNSIDNNNRVCMSIIKYNDRKMRKNSGENLRKANETRKSIIEAILRPLKMYAQEAVVRLNISDFRGQKKAPRPQERELLLKEYELQLKRFKDLHERLRQKTRKIYKNLPILNNKPMHFDLNAKMNNSFCKRYLNAVRAARRTNDTENFIGKEEHSNNVNETQPIKTQENESATKNDEPITIREESVELTRKWKDREEELDFILGNIDCYHVMSSIERFNVSDQTKTTELNPFNQNDVKMPIPELFDQCNAVNCRFCDLFSSLGMTLEDFSN